MDGLLDAWDWDGPVHTEEIEAGLINRTFWVRGTNGDVHAVLQELNTRIFKPAVHLDIKAVTEALAAHGMLTPRLVPTRQGELWHTDPNGGVWRRMTVVGSRTVHKVHDLHDARSAGELVARFHEAVRDLDWEFQSVRPDVHDTQRHMDALAAAVDSHPEHRLIEPVSRLCESLHLAWQVWTGPDQLPPRIVHGDLKISNVRFDEGDAVALIDLDTLARRTLDVEMGDAMRSWCNPLSEDSLDGHFDVDIFGAAMEGYAQGCRTGVGLSDDEWSSIVPCTQRIAMELSARFAKDALEECYFGWKTEFGTRGDHNPGPRHRPSATGHQPLCPSW